MQYKRSLYACDTPIGSRGTMAVMAYLLRIANREQAAAHRIFVVLPFSNVIHQSDVYRRSLVLKVKT
jgi:hypothetical protein